MPVDSVKILPFYFGDDGKQLFGCYHQPRPANARSFGIVICQPILHEYIYCHRALRQLATRLCDAGFPVLRFDYYGCGDSNGNDEDASMRQWLDDTSQAVSEMRARAGVTQICLVGLRLGGTLSMITAAERGGVDSLVLWEPIARGKAYLDELNALQRESLRLRPKPARHGDRQSHFEVIGFPLSQLLCNELEKLDLFAIRQTAARRILAIHNSEAGADRNLGNHLSRNGSAFEQQHFPAPPIWLPTTDGSLHVPGQVIQSLVAWSSRTCA